MHTSRFFTAALSALLFLSSPLFAKDPKPNGQKKELTREEIAKLGGFEPAPGDVEDQDPRDIVADLLIVSVPDSAAIGLIEDLKDPAKVDAAGRQLQSMVESKKARLIGWPNLQTKTGHRAVIENINEVRYAIEFDRGAAAAPAKEDAKGDEQAKAAQPPGPAAPPVMGVLPTTFETRNAGLTLELEPIAHPGGKVIDAQLSAQHVQLLGWDPTAVEENGKTTARIPQPRFHTNKVTTSLTTESGKRHLIGAFRSGDNKEETEIFLFRLTSKPRKGK